MVAGPTRALRVMVDATVLVAGSGWPRWPHEVLLAALRGEFELVLSPYLIDQARRVIDARFSTAHLQRFEELLDEVSFILAPDPSPQDLTAHAGLVRDETDIPLLLSAIAANVDVLVSEDKDLTELRIISRGSAPPLVIVLSGTFLRQYVGWTSDDLEKVRGRTWRDLQNAESE